MSFTGEVQFQVLDGAAGIFSGPANNVQVVIGCAPGGTVNAVVPTRNLTTLSTTFLGGAMMEACGLVLNAGGTVLAVRAAQNTAGTITAAAVPAAITATDTNSPIQVTSVAHGLSTGDVVIITGVVGQTGANGTWRITKVGADTFTLDDSTSVGAWVSGGAITFTGSVMTSATATTGAMWFTGTPIDDCYPMGVVDVGFTQGTTGGTVRISLDAGRNYGPPIPMGTAATINIADAGGVDTGLVLHFSATKVFTGGGVVNGLPVGDYTRCSTTGPQPNAAGISAALTAVMAYLAGSAAGFPLVQVVGNFAGSDATAFESGGTTNLDNMATNYVFVRMIMSLRDAHAPVAWGGVGETEAAWMAALNLDTSGITARRVCATGGHYNMPTAFPTQIAGSPSYRRPFSFALAARQVAIDPQRHAGKAGGAQGGALPQILVSPATDGSDGFVYHDEFLNPSFDYQLPAGVGRIASSRTRARKVGRFAADPLLLAPFGSDFWMLPKGIVMDVACVEAHDALEDFQYADLITNANGTLSDSAATTVGGAVRDRISGILVAAGMISGFAVVVDQATNLQVTPKLKVTISILGVVYVLETDVTIGFASSLPAS